MMAPKTFKHTCGSYIFSKGREMFLFYFLVSLILSNVSGVSAGTDPLQCSDHGRPDITVPVLNSNPLAFIPNLKIVSESNDEPLQNFEINLKLLILSATNNPAEEPSIELIKKSLHSYNIPFDHVVLTANGRRIDESRLALINDDGSAKYYGTITTTGQLIFKNEKGIFESGLTLEQWSQLEKYEKDFNVRRVSIYSFPHPGIGVEQSTGFLAPDPTFIHFNNLAKNSVEPDQVGLRRDIKIPTSKIWFYPTQIKDPTLASPMLYFEYAGKKEVGGITVKFSDKRQQMHFFFSQDHNSLASALLSPVWINWITKAVYLGKRRLYFNIQVDDFFLSTRLWEPTKLQIYRVNQNEISNFIIWQKSIMQSITGNPNFKIELAFNGWGVLDNGTIAHDQLYIFTRTRVEEFNWVSHTFSHPNLNDMLFEPIDSDLKKNIDFADNFFGPFKNYFSPQSIVTPGISGLFNKDAIRALLNNKIFYAIGDNSRPELAPLKPYHARYTTEASNGMSGLLIIPRYPTHIYFNVSTPQELTSQYNVFYPQLGGKVDFDQIYADEIKRVTNLIYYGEPAGHMFHQANLRLFAHENNQVSLLSLWMQKIVNQVRNYLTLPILSLKMDELALLYKERMELDDCGVQAKMVIVNHKMITIKIHSQNNCKVGITGIDPVLGNGMTVEKYGTEQTTYFQTQGNSQITLKTPLNF